MASKLINIPTKTLSQIKLYAVAITVVTPAIWGIAHFYYEQQLQKHDNRLFEKNITVKVDKIVSIQSDQGRKIDILISSNQEIKANVAISAQTLANHIMHDAKNTSDIKAKLEEVKVLFPLYNDLKKKSDSIQIMEPIQLTALSIEIGK